MNRYSCESLYTNVTDSICCFPASGFLREYITKSNLVDIQKPNRIEIFWQRKYSCCDGTISTVNPICVISRAVVLKDISCYCTVFRFLALSSKVNTGVTKICQRKTTLTVYFVIFYNCHWEFKCLICCQKTNQLQSVYVL